MEYNTHLESLLAGYSIRILSTYIPKESFQDHFTWSESKSGSLRVKDFYAHYLLHRGNLESPQRNRPFWSKLWASDLNPKWKFFLWRLLQKALATNSNLIKRNIPVQDRCYSAICIGRTKIICFGIAPFQLEFGRNLT